MPITQITEQQSSSRHEEEPTVEYEAAISQLRFNESDTCSIVAVQGFDEDATETWTHPASRSLWLRDLLPARLRHFRVLIFSCAAEPFTSPDLVSTTSIMNNANNLVQELYADRDLENAIDRPIIFVCHGFGGLLVKRALAFSHSRQASHLEHLRSIYTCTYGILFFGTPHNGFSKESLLSHQKGSSYLIQSLLKGSELLNEINDQFAPLMKQFAIFNFWEELQTQHTTGKFFVVDQDSAAPAWDSVEKCGIMGTHTSITKFEDGKDRRLRPVLEALSRYAKSAPTLIKERFAKDVELMDRKRQQEADELRRPRPQPSPHSSTSPPNENQWCIMSRKSISYFTGRKKHATQVRKLLSPIRRHEAHSKTKVVVIYGLGGSGKTQFCLRYVEDNKHSYWGVFWIDASTEKNVESAYALIGVQAGRGATMASAMHWLSQSTKPWLLVLDNADDPDIDISAWYPTDGNGSVLITTRNPNAVEHATVGHLRFRGMEPVEAVRLLLRAAYPQHQHETLTPTSPTRWQLAEGIAVELGYLPLAIRHAGVTIRKNIYTLERYLKYYLPRRRTMLSHSADLSVDDANIRTTWEIPFERMVSRDASEYKDAVDLMYMFAFMHHETIPERIFQRHWSSFTTILSTLRPNPSILQPVWTEEAQARLRRAIGVLCDYSIIEYEPQEGLCTMHPVVHSWARDRLSETDQVYWLRFTTAVLAYCVSTNTEISGEELRVLCIPPILEASGRQFRALLVPHINFCLQMQKVRFTRKNETLQVATEREIFAWVFVEQGQWKMARQLQEDTVRYRTKALGKRHQDTIRARHSLGQTLWNLFEVRATVELQRKTVTVLYATRPRYSDWAIWPIWQPTHTSYCLALSELTNALWLGQERSWAKYTGERAVTGLSKRLGPEDPLTLKAMFHLARTYLHTGEEKKCHALLLWVIRRQKRFFGKNHVDTLMTRNELGMLLCASKRHLTAALRIVENVLDTRRRILGEEHAYTLWSINDLSKVYTELGRVDEAVNMLEEMIPVVTRTLGEHHVGMSMTKGNLSRAYFLLERWDDALACLLPGLQKLPPDHPDWINAMYGRSHILFKQGKLAEAEKECVDLIDRIKSKKILPLNHPRTISIADLLLDIYGSQGRNDMIKVVKKEIPSAGLTKSEERFDPYGIRKGSLQPSQIPGPSSSDEQWRRDSHQYPPHDRQILFSTSLEQDPKPNLIARRTF